MIKIFRDEEPNLLQHCTLCLSQEDLLRMQFNYDKSHTGGVGVSLCPECRMRMKQLLSDKEGDVLKGNY